AVDPFLSTAERCLAASVFQYLENVFHVRSLEISTEISRSRAGEKAQTVTFALNLIYPGAPDANVLWPDDGQPCLSDLGDMHA
ncbi:MAG: hypothetical protein AAFZ46_18810, partial [Pseudomonadota bacterium]